MNSQEKTWIKPQGITMKPEYVRAVMGQLSLALEFSDLFYALKNILMCLSYSKQATLRNKAMKIIRQLIKNDPQKMLQDEEIQTILKLRITDVSSVTRESALDILSKNIENLVSMPDSGSILLDYMNMVIERAQTDTNINVRKKIIQILSSILDIKDNQNQLDSLKNSIIQILISKWNDASSQVRSSLISSIQKIVKTQVKGQVSQFNILFEIVEFHLKDNYSVEIKGGVTMKSRLVSEQNDSVISEIFSEVLQVDQIRNKKPDPNALIRLYGNDIIKEALDNLYKASAEHKQDEMLLILTNLKMINLIGAFDKASLRNNIKTIIEIAQRISCRPQASILTIQMICQLYTDAYLDIQDLDWLSSKNSSLMQEFALKTMNSSPLINLKGAIKLLNVISLATQNLKLVVNPLSRCLMYLQALLKKNDLTNVLAISRSVLICSHMVSMCDHLPQIEKALGLDIKSQLTSTLKQIIEDKDIDAMILDIVLEGLSYVWLKYPEKVMQQEQNDEIFEIVSDRFKTKMVQAETKSMILQTFTKFLKVHKE